MRLFNVLMVLLFVFIVVPGLVIGYWLVAYVVSFGPPAYKVPAGYPRTAVFAYRAEVVLAASDGRTARATADQQISLEVSGSTDGLYGLPKALAVEGESLSITFAGQTFATKLDNEYATDIFTRCLGSYHKSFVDLLAAIDAKTGPCSPQFPRSRLKKIGALAATDLPQTSTELSRGIELVSFAIIPRKVRSPSAGHPANRAAEDSPGFVRFN